MYYTSVEEAFADNNTTSGSVTVYTDEIDMTGISYKGTIVVPEGNDITISNAPSTLKVQLADGTVLTPDANGTVATKINVATLAELQAALASDSTLPIVITETIVIPEGETVEVDLNGKTVTVPATDTGRHIYALNNKGVLTIKDTKGTGSISARGIYNGYNGSSTDETVAGAKMIVNGGKFVGLDSNGGAAIFNCAELEITAGDFTGGVAAINNRAKGVATINGGTYHGGNNYVLQNNGGTMTINTASVDSGFGAVGCFGGTTTIYNGTYLPTGAAGKTCHVVYVAGGAKVTIAGGVFKMNYPADAVPDSGSVVASYYNGTLAISDGSFTAHFDNVSPVELSSGSEITGGTYLTHSGAASNHGYVKNFVKEGYELKADGQVVAKPVAKIGTVEYTTLAEAFAAAKAGDEIVLLANISDSVTTPAGIILNGNGKQIAGTLYLMGDVTLKGHVKANAFDFENVGTEINIPAGATFEITGAGRMIIGHGCTFNITGTITDAKTADKATLTPSLVMPGASFTGAGVTFNVNNAYIKAPSSYCSSSKSASGTFDFNIENSVIETAGKLAFEAQSTAATVNFELKNSVLNTGSHLVFGVAAGEVVIDNSNVNVGKLNQIENRSTMTVKNGSVVNGAVATSSNAINSGTIIVENATYAVTGQFSGSTVGTGTLIIKQGANVSVGSIVDKANIQIDATGMTADEAINFTSNLSKFTGTVEVINNDKLEASIVDGKIVLSAKPVAQIGEQTYTTLEAAFAAATEGQTITLLMDATPVLASQRAITKAAVIDLNGKTLTLTEDDLYFGTTTFQNGTIVVDPSVKPSTAVFWMFANQTLTFDNVKVVATGVTGTYLIGLDGNNSDLNLLNGSEILVENTTALDLDIICVNASTGNDIVIDDSKINVTNLDGRVLFRGNYTISGTSEINLEGITKAGIRIEAGQTLSIEDDASVTIAGELRDGGIHLTDYTSTYTKADTATVNATVNKPAVAKIGETDYDTIAEAIDAAKSGDTIELLTDVTVEGTAQLPAGITIKSNGKKINGSIRMLGDLTLDGPLTITGGLWVGKSGETLTATLSGAKLTASYFMFQHGTYTINADIDAVYGYLSFNGTFKVNSTIHTTGANGEVLYINGNVTLNDGAVLDSDNSVFVCNDNAVLTLKAGSKVDSNVNITTSGAKVYVDATGMTSGANANITGNVTNSGNGTVAVVNSDMFVAQIESGKIVLVGYVAKIGEQKYTSLQSAVDVAVEGDMITLLSDVEQADGVLITDKKLTIDLNGKTFTVSNGASTNNRNFKINGSSEVTITNGTLVAKGELTSGAYGTVRTEGAAVANLIGLKLYSYRGYGLNVKACTGTTINIKDTEIYAQYSGGVESASGTINLTNVKIEQTGVYSGAAWCSVAIGVNGGGKVVVNSGTYSAKTIASDANAAQGTWVAYVMSSGGTLEINDGTFNGVVAETATAANACGIICADTKAVVEINGGTFNSNGAILDMRNNTGATPNPTATLKGGTYSADPRVSGLYSSNLIKVAEGYVVTENDGVYTVAKAVAKIDNTDYVTLEEAFKAATSGCTIDILSDVTIDYKWDCRDYATGGSHSQFKEAVTINGNGHTLKFTGAVNDNNWNTIFRFEENATVNNLTVDISEATGAQRVISAKKSLTVDGLTIVGSARYGIIFGEGASADDFAAAEIVVKNSTLTGTRRAISDNESAKDVKSVVITGNTLNANVYASASESITFNNNTAAGEVDLRSYTAENVLSVEAKGNTLTAGVKNYIYAKNIDAQADFTTKRPPFKVATKAELNAALAAAQDGDVVTLTADIDYGTDQLALTKAITLDLGRKTLTTRNGYGGMSVKGNPTVKNGTIVHASNTAAIKVWNATAFEDLVIDVQGKGDANKTIGGIVLQSGSTTRVGSIKNVTIKGAALTNGIETYNCGDATENVIGSMENVTIDAQGTGMLISAPCGTATNCNIKGGVNGVEIFIKGNYSASLDLVKSTVEGGVYAHDEFNNNPNIVNNGTLSFTVDNATTGADDVTLTLNRAENIEGVLASIKDDAQAKVGATYYATLEAAFAAAKDGETITFLKNATPALTSQKAITKAAVIDLGGKTLTLTEDDLYFGTTTFQNGNIVVDPSVRASTAVFWMFEGQTLTFNKVKLTATGVTGTYLIGTWKAATPPAALNIIESEIIVQNDSPAKLSALIADNGTRMSVVIDKSTINVKNLDGRLYLGHNDASVTVTDSNINLDGVKEGFYLRANQTLAINGNSNINITLNDDTRYGINITDPSSTYTKAESATVNATLYKAPFTVSTYEQLIAALAEDNAYVVLANDITATATQQSGYGKAGIVVDAGDVLDGNGKTLTINGANATWDCVIAMKGGEVKNLTIAGAMRGVFMPGANGDVVIDNCKFQNVIYTFNSDAGSKDYTVTIKNTELNGWTSFSDVHKSVTFENCSFAKGNGYAYCRPYQATTFKDCSFSDDFAFDCSRVADNKLAFNGCTYNGQAITSENAFDLFGDGAKVLVNGAPADYTKVAQVGGQIYSDLQEAIKAAAPAGTVELLKDVTVEKWTMISESLTIGDGTVVTLDMNGLTIDGNGYTLTVNDVESANNGNHLFYDGDFNICDLTLNMGANVNGVGITSGTISNVTFNGGSSASAGAAIHVSDALVASTHAGNVTIEGCTFKNNGGAIYYETAQNGLVVNNNTFEIPSSANVILLRGTEQFTNNTVISGRTVNVVSGSPVVTGNDFGDVRLKVYNDATATISGNTINNLVFDKKVPQSSTFTDNTLSAEAQAALNAMNFVAQIGTTYYTSIADAIAVANANDTVTILAGNYTQDISVNKAITVQGATDANGNNLVNITGRVSASTGATVKNLNVHNEKTGNYDCAIYVDGSNIVIDGCQMTGYNGMRNCYAKGDVTIKNSTINGSNFAVHFDGSNGGNLTIEKCNITGWVSYGGGIDQVTLKDSTFDAGSYAGQRSYADKLVVEDCKFKAGYKLDVAVEGSTVEVTGSQMADGSSIDEVFNKEDMLSNNVIIDGTPVTYVAKIGNAYYATLEEALANVATWTTIKLVADATLDYGAREAYGRDDTTDIIIDGQGFTLTLNQTNSDWSSIGLKNANGKLTLKNMTIEKTGYGDTSGAWNTHAIIFSSNVEMNKVTVNNGIAVSNGATLKDVTINEANGYYGLWIYGNGQAVTVNGGAINATNGGRGIKIADEYIDAPAKVTLNVTGTKFNTAKKAAVLVSSEAGADISASNVDITNVAEDKVNFAWVDDGWATHYGKVAVTGGTLTLEPGTTFVASLSTGDKLNGYYKTLADAVAAAQAGDTITLLRDVESSEVILIGKSVTINGNGKKVTSNATRVFRVTASNTEVTLNGVNMVSRTVMTYPNDIRGISIDASLSNVKLTLNGCSVDFTDASACDWAYAVNISGNGTGHILIVNGGTYEGANAVNVHGADNTIVVKDAILTSLYPNHDTYYGAGIWVLQNQGSSVEATGNTFNGSNAVAFNLGTGTALTESNNIDNTTRCVAKIGDQYYTSLKAAFAAAQDGDEVKILIAGTYALATSGKNITITGAVDGVVFDNIGEHNMGGASMTFNNVTFNYAMNSMYKGLQHSGNLVYNNCTINGQVFLYGDSETFNNCVFNQEDPNSYNVWTYSADPVAFKNCTFNCKGKSVLIYHENASVQNNVTVTDCDFIAYNAVAGKAAIEMDSSLTAGITLTIDAATTATGFGTGNVSGNSLWNNKKGANTDANNDITVVVDGQTVLAPRTFVAQIGTVKYFTLAEALAAAQNDAVVELLWADGDAPIAMNGSVYGKSVTITGTATVDWSKGWLFVGRGGEGDGTVIFDNAKLTSTEASLKNGSYGIHVSAPEKGSTTKCNGTVIIRNNSDIQLSYLANRHNVTVDNSRLYVEYGFWVGGRPSGETPDSQPGVANMELVNNSTVTVKNHNGMGVGHESIGNLMIEAGSTFEYLGDEGLMICNAASLVSAGNFFGKINAQENSNIQISGGVYTQNVNEWCVTGYAALPNLNDQYVVGVKPTATVKNLGAMTIPAKEYYIYNGSLTTGTEPMPLNFVMQFVANQNADDMLTSPFANWYADFVITFEGVEGDSFDATGCYLAGYYGSTDSWDGLWVKIPVDGLLEKIEKGVRYPVMLGVNMAQTYTYICSGVQAFSCAMYIPDEILKDNPNLKVKLELNVVDSSEGEGAAYDALVNGENIFNASETEYTVDDFIVGLAGSGTEEDPFLIKDLDDLIFFRDSVNAGETKYNAEGVYVALGADIDMSSVDWSVNIGDDCNATFDGIFDGKNYTISNLTSTETALKGDGYICTGLFGAIYGSAQIKNLTLENVNITAEYTGNNVAALVGFAYNCSGVIDNVIVKNVSINAANATGVGAIVGYDYYSPALKVTNCTVDGTSIKGTAYVGGVIGYASTKIELNNNTVKNLTLNGTASVGGLAGIMLAGGSASGNTVEKVQLSATGAMWANSIGLIAGTITTGSVTVSGTTAIGCAVTDLIGGILVEKPTSPIEKVQVQLGDSYFTTLDAAINAAKAGDTIKLLTNVGTDAALVINKELTVDLNGKTIAATENDKVGDGVFCVVAGGELTINDSLGTGVINGVGGNNYNIAIWANGGKVTINGGNFTNVGATDNTDPNAHFDLIYVKNGGEVVINGGTFKCETPAFTLNSHDTYKGVITVNGGTFVGFDPRNNAAETAGTTFMAAGKYTFAEGGNYIVVTPEDYILNGVASNSATVGDVDSLLAGAVTVTKDGEKYVATATYTFKVTAVDTINPEKSSYELTGGKLRPGKTVAVKYIDLATGTEAWEKPESDTVTFKLVIK